MKKLFLVLCVVIMFFGIVGCPSDNQTTTPQTPTAVTQSVSSGTVGGDGGSGASPVPEPATLILLGTGLVGLTVIVRNRFKK